MFSQPSALGQIPNHKTNANTKVRASHLGRDRTYGGRQVSHDLLADGMSCGCSASNA